MQESQSELRIAVNPTVTNFLYPQNLRSDSVPIELVQFTAKF